MNKLNGQLIMLLVKCFMMSTNPRPSSLSRSVPGSSNRGIKVKVNSAILRYSIISFVAQIVFYKLTACLVVVKERQKARPGADPAGLDCNFQ
jgi:hypothetical protein